MKKHLLRKKKKLKSVMKIVISGGGTGGHVYPAIAIADALKEINSELDILFVGAESKMEMIAVPKAGYNIIGLNISGFQRKLSWQNFKLLFRLISSLIKAYKVLKNFKPDAVLGVGGYASGPVLRIAAWMNIPIFIQEQNSYAGMTNRLMAAKAKKIFVAFNGMENFFKDSKISLLGNPVRSSLSAAIDRSKALQHFQLDPTKKTIGVFGGSLGARTLNQEINSWYEYIASRNDIQIIWQTGKAYWEEYRSLPIAKLDYVKMLPFIDNMDFAYSVCDLAITRAGAITISELAVTATPAILVPSPNVAEDHQTKNAESLVKENAALMIADKNVKGNMLNEVLKLINDQDKLNQIRANLKRIAKPNASQDIAEEILNIKK